MMPQHHNTHAGPPVSPRAAAAPGRGGAPPGAPPLPVDVSHATLAHELANLLDGGLRNLNLALSRLRDGQGHAAPAAGPDHESDDLLRRLEAANGAMQQMATLIHRWRHEPAGAAGAAMHAHPAARTLGEVVRQTLGLLAPLAMARRIELRSDVSAAAAVLPAGNLYPILVNALRNSIEAIDASAPPAAVRGKKARGPRGRVEVAAGLASDGLVLAVRDDGPGFAPELFDPATGFRFGATTKTGGHGLGLSLARDIARGLGGQLELRDLRPQGAELRLTCPYGGEPSSA